MAETQDGFASLSLAVRSYGYTVKEIRETARTIYSYYGLEAGLEYAATHRRNHIASPSVYAVWDAIYIYLGGFK